MPNQTDYDRVNICMMAPLMVLFGKKFADEVIDGYVEELASFNDATLKAAFKALRRDCKYLPSLAAVIEACEAQKPKAQYVTPKQRDTEHCRGHAERAHPNSVREIFSTPAGQLALKLGVGRELLLQYEITGRKDFDEPFVRKCRGHLEEAVRELVKYPAINDISKAMHSLWDAMQEREKRLFAQYSLKLQHTA